jgi:nicotinate-nucleotide adenylyltransferase
MKIGLLGGSFNPIHNGHIALALCALKKLKLNEIWFLPTGNHPLKEKTDVLPFKIRSKLVKTVLEKYPGFIVSNLDSDQNNLNYTDKLMKDLYEKFQDYDFYFIVGEDIVLELPEWHNYKWLLDNVKIIVLNRPDTDKSKWKDLDYLGKLTFLEMQPVDISSSQIRKLAKQGKSISGLVPVIIESEIICYYGNLYCK